MKRITECKSGLSLIVVLLCFMSQLNAQEVLSLEDCRRLSVENNKKTENCRRGSESERGAEGGGFHGVFA